MVFYYFTVSTSRWFHNCLTVACTSKTSRSIGYSPEAEASACRFGISRKLKTNPASVDSDEACCPVGKAMGYDVLGRAPDDDVADFGEDMGALKQRRWDNLEWAAPVDKTTPCWWFAPWTRRPTHRISRSLICLRLELSATRCATSVKLRLDWVKRLADNACAVAALQARTSLWHRVHGPHTLGSLQPTLLRLQAAQQAATLLRQLIDFRSEDVDLASCGGEILKAIEQLKLVAWDATHQQ